MQFASLTILSIAFAALSAAAPAESLAERSPLEERAAQVQNTVTIYSDNGCLNKIRSIDLNNQCATAERGFASLKINTHAGNGKIRIYPQLGCAGAVGRAVDVDRTGCQKDFAFGAGHSVNQS